MWCELYKGEVCHKVQYIWEIIEKPDLHPRPHSFILLTRQILSGKFFSSCLGPAKIKAKPLWQSYRSTRYLLHKTIIQWSYRSTGYIFYMYSRKFAMITPCSSEFIDWFWWFTWKIHLPAFWGLCLPDHRFMFETPFQFSVSTTEWTLPDVLHFLFLQHFTEL